jgi:multicomponent Na+:H+ antiporter subunit D
MLIIGTASILIGGFGAASRQNIESMLAYSSIGQVGFIILPLGVAALYPALAPLAVTAALIYSLNHAIAKSLLFLVAGNIKKASGSTEYSNLGGIARKMKTSSIAFLIGGLSLVGIPPLLGFFGKLAVLKSSIPILPVTAVVVVGSILTIYYISNAWNSIFWGEPVKVRDIDNQLLTPVVFLAVLLVALGIGADTVFPLAENAADAALNTETYINTVLEASNE